jgi:hypothetical protein
LRNPADGSPTLAHLLSHGDGRDERIVDHDRDVSRPDKTESDVGAVVLVVADPVAAMNVDLNRGEAGLIWPEYVETLAPRWPIRQIELAANRFACASALCGPARPKGLQSSRRNLGCVVVFAVKRGAIVVTKDHYIHLFSPIRSAVCDANDRTRAGHARVQTQTQVRSRRESLAAHEHEIIIGLIAQTGKRFLY